MTSYKPEILTPRGQRWRPILVNYVAVRFATYDEAQACATARAMQWNVMDTRVVEFDGPPIAAWEDGKLRVVPPPKEEEK